ncbi:hypothetical protein OU798_00885 [Prolixibacteraceae bacterium Z1-6]|uniref:Lipoprotein n=1 Tax=Draconibacterium aestuarii TaxID=2998507 RepID=A0A9X3J5R5_9BACT|nr:hypothetical protein [Prolixibacteraceae bacterium Z1-6]
MKNLFLLSILIVLLSSCASTNKMTDKEFRNSVIGQNEITLFSRLGPPTKIILDREGGKVMIYEHYSKGMFLTPNKSNITYNFNTDLSGKREGVTYTSNVNKETNDPQYSIYQQNVFSLKLFLDKHGNCVRYEQNLPREQLEVYHERFKHFLPKE